MAYLRLIRKGKAKYYQIVKDDGRILQLGTIDKMIGIFEFWHDHKLKVVGKSSEFPKFA